MEGSCLTIRRLKAETLPADRISHNECLYVVKSQNPFWWTLHHRDLLARACICHMYSIQDLDKCNKTIVSTNIHSADLQRSSGKPGNNKLETSPGWMATPSSSVCQSQQCISPISSPFPPFPRARLGLGARASREHGLIWAIWAEICSMRAAWYRTLPGQWLSETILQYAGALRVQTCQSF